MMMRHASILIVAIALNFASCGESAHRGEVRHASPVGKLTLIETTVDIPQADFGDALYTDELGYRRLDFTRFDRTDQGRVFENYRAIILENKYIRLTLLLDRGKPYSLIYKVTGHEELFIPTTAHALGSPNELGWWFVLGGVEYTLPDKEHGTTWAAEWDYAVTENSESRKTVEMSVRETVTGLEETLSISVQVDRAYYEAELTIRNPTDSTIAFQHWINPMWAPGGQGQITPDTEFIIPTESVSPTDRPFNEWMLDYHPGRERRQQWEGNPMRYLAGWKSTGDLLAGVLEEGFYSAYSHDADEGIVRVFPADVNPGVNIWAWGDNPPPDLRRLFSGSDSTLGYVEMWGGITPGFDDYYELEPGASLNWVEWMYPYRHTGGLHFANMDMALTFFVEEEDYTFRICPSGDLEDVRAQFVDTSGAVVDEIYYPAIQPGDRIEAYMFSTESPRVELVVLHGGEEITRLRAVSRGFEP